MKRSATGKRYVDLPGVALNEDRIPTSLRSILKYAREWALVGDSALDRQLSGTPKQKIRASVDAARPLFEQIYAFAFESPDAKAIPIPDEVVIFQMYWTSLQAMEAEIRNEK
jgi:hypothetical protein